MYFSLISSYEHFCENINDEDKCKDTNNYLINNQKDTCLICWMPTEENNEVKKLSNFSHINIICNCQPKIHYLCLNSWIHKNSSCPICRKKIFIKSLNLKKTNIFEKLYYYNQEYNLHFCKTICFISFSYLMFIFLCNIYFSFIIEYEDGYDCL